MAEGEQEVELAGGQLQIPPGPGGRTPGGLDGDVADGQGPLGSRFVQAHHGVQAGGELCDGERLDDIVVGAGSQPGDPVVDLVTGGEHARAWLAVRSAPTATLARRSRAGDFGGRLVQTLTRNAAADDFEVVRHERLCVPPVEHRRHVVDQEALRPQID
ncbi:hypothetical protein AB0D13_32060 [Streptomyces sp. NPDC048430]|uniref:hypothetical protein n=1 Tax=Streptomyces sp. NPDC048430 TaxID=3155388 RepID=UPI003418E307